MSTLLTGLGFVLTMFLNTLSSKFAHSIVSSSDKDILLPFSVTIFLFFPLLIYLPEAHYKVVTYGGPEIISTEEAETDEEEKFPFAFLFTLISIILSIILHRIVFWQISIESQSLMPHKDHRHHHDHHHGHHHGNGSDSELSSNRDTEDNNRNKEQRAECQILKYFLSIALGLLNIVNAFYITAGETQSVIFNEFVIFGIFTLIIHFAYGYLNSWSMVDKELNTKLSIFINFGTLIGYFLGLLVENNLLILILPTLSCGLMIYSSTLVCLPALFSNGENHTQDKFRYGAIFTSLLVTVVYHPFCYLLRV